MRKTVIAFAALCVASSALAQPTPTPQATATNKADTAAQAAGGVGEHSTPGTLSGRDRDFLQDAAQGSFYELALAKLAQQNASKPEIKQFAQTIIRDHEQINSGLEHLAQAKGVQLPTQMSAENQSKLGHIQSLSGGAFDQAFTAEMARINGEDKQKLDQEIGATQDNDMKAFAGQMQTADDNHKKLSEQL